MENGLLRHLIADTYTPESLGQIKQVLAEYRTHQILPVANGLFAASSSQAVDSATGYQNVWIRDNVMVADSLRRRGELAPAIACMQGLTRFFQKQMPRFREIIDDPVRVLREDANRRPHIRFTAQTLGELPEKWPHAQNDALGHALWFRYVLANSGALPMSAADYEIYGIFPAYFGAIEYWQDRDSGAWEEGRKINNSSVGAVVAGLEEMQKHHAAAGCGGAGDLVCLEQLITKGRDRLDPMLPFESPPERLADSALLFLIHPLNVVRTRVMEDAILNLVQARLKGEIGIKRYADDSYFCQDYDEWFAPGQMSTDFSERLDFRDEHLQPNCEAQWCIFDPVLSIIYGQRFLANRADRPSFEKQVHYFNRSLAQVTQEGACPELYFLKHGRYIANVHTPLAWTQANQALALYLMEKSVGEII
ncbi:MAG: glycoside hydrolase family 15 protein [Candidatus Acidiferrum sp.]